jgi:glycine/D-amino acid oxidase-like deaminating enzyme
MTDDSYFCLDKVHQNIAVFAGGSGRAFKFGPLIGDCITSLLNGQEPPVDIKPFSVHRDAVKKSFL